MGDLENCVVRVNGQHREADLDAWQAAQDATNRKIAELGAKVALLEASIRGLLEKIREIERERENS